MIVIINMGARHSFVSLDCAEMLDLKLSGMDGSMVIDTPYNGSVTISWVYSNCPLTIYNKSFKID